MYDFMANSPVLTFFLALIAAWATVRIVYLPVNFYRAVARRKNIHEHGWPIAPIDADGDVVYPDEEEWT